MKWKSLIDDLLRESCVAKKDEDSLKEKQSVVEDDEQNNGIVVSGVNININGNKNCQNFNIGNQGFSSQSIDDKHATNCKACGHIVARAAKACPHCGQPAGVSQIKRHILLGAMLLTPLIAGPPSLFGFIH